MPTPPRLANVYNGDPVPAQWVSGKTLAAVYGIPEGTLRYYVSTGKLPRDVWRKPLGRVFYNLPAFDAWFRSDDTDNIQQAS